MIFSLIAMTIAFTGLVVWVYWPSHRSHFEALGMLVFEPDTAVQEEQDR
mgnify:CR=1 FL=1